MGESIPSLESSSSRSESSLAAIDRQLRQPARLASIGGILAAWRHDEVIAVCARPKHLEDCPDLSVRVRGALGRRLHDTHLRRASGGLTAWQLLWHYQPPRHCGVEVARPYVINASIIGDVVLIAVRLFGRSRLFAADVLHSLAEALSGGIRLKSPRGIFVRLDVRHVEIVRFEGLEMDPGSISACHLQLMTATAVRSGHNLVLDPVALLMSAVRRVAAVAPWMNVALDCDRDRLRAACSRLQFDMSRVHTAEWVRYSLRQGPEGIAVHGIQGDIYINGQMQVIYPYLRLAEITGIGSSTALGLGQICCIFT